MCFMMHLQHCYYHWTPLAPTSVAYIISYSCPSLRYTHHLWLCPRQSWMSCPCWYLVNLPWPAASVSQTEKPHTWVLVSRDRPQEPRTPCQARGGRQAGQRRAKQKHNLASPRQTAHLLSASIWATATQLPLFTFWWRQIACSTHTKTHTAASGWIYSGSLNTDSLPANLQNLFKKWSVLKLKTYL